MRQMNLHLFFALTVLVLVASPVWALLAGFNVDVHMDIDPTGRTIANDFHIKGTVKSGEPDSGWANKPQLVMQIGAGFPIFVISDFMPVDDPKEPGAQNTWAFEADWSFPPGDPGGYKYCEVIHLGLLFDVECHNTVIDIVGWWTLDGKRLENGQNGGYVLIPGFDVQDRQSPQILQIRNDTGKGIDPGVGGRTLQVDLLVLTAEQMKQMFGVPEELFPMLRADDPMQQELPWVRVPDVMGQDFPPDSFFDVFVEIDIPGTGQVMHIEQNGFLVARTLFEFPNNIGELERRWIWHFHEAHDIVQGELDFGDAPEGVDATGAPSGKYPTLMVSNGARHFIRGPWLGGDDDKPDPEPDAQPDPLALRDDNDGNDDEDGVKIPILQIGRMMDITVIVNGGGGMVDAWIDWDNNGIWEPSDRIFGAFLLNGVHPIPVTPPANAVAEETYARFRINSGDNLDPDGPADDGEVEDYTVKIIQGGFIEVDEFDFTIGDVEIGMPDGTSELVALSGPTTVHVFFENNEGQAQDDDGDGRDEVVTEMVQLDLAGVSPTFGPVRITVHPTIKSMGLIEETVNDTPGLLDLAPFGTPGTTADSFFDIFFEVEVGGMTLHTETPKRMSARIRHKPPAPGDWYENVQIIPLLDPAGNDTGFTLGAGRHLPRPKTEIDMFPDMPAQIVLVMPDGSREAINLQGPMTQHVYFEGTAEGDCTDDNGNGRDEVQTEIVAVDLTGTSSFGPVAVRLNSALPSAGLIEEMANNTPGLLDVPPFVGPGATADSFFDVFVEIDLGSQRFVARSPLSFAGRISHKPAAPCDEFVSITPVELLNENGEPTGFLIETARIKPAICETIEFDLFEDSALRMGLVHGSGQTDTLELTGPVEQHVFFEGLQEGLADDDDGNGRDEVQTEIVSMNLTGENPTLGTIRVSLSPMMMTLPGIHEETVNNTPGLLDVQPFTSDGYVDSFFDVFFDIEINGQSFILRTPVTMHGRVSHKPASPCDQYGSDERVELLDAAGRPTGIFVGPFTFQPNPCNEDWGDAPEKLAGLIGGYKTLKINNGARHRIDPSVFLGNRIDGEADGQPTNAADGDDMLDGNDDEDGVKFLTWPLRPGRFAKVEVTASVDGFLSAWVDFDKDGTWMPAGNRIFNGMAIPAGTHVYSFWVPMTAKKNVTTFSRWRFATYPVTSPEGAADDGEVEDHIVKIRSNPNVKWIQRPDETPMGIDIRVDSSDGIMRVLADDWECTEYGPITDVHLWVSWLHDIKGEIESIHLSVHNDIPVEPDEPASYSRPGDLKWEADFGPDSFEEKLFRKVEEGEFWWDPYDGKLIPNGDHEIWQIDIDIPASDAFQQEGTPDDPVVYWLDVSIKLKDDIDAAIGWKTRRYPNQWNDDAVMGTSDIGVVYWNDLHYPPGHPNYDENPDNPPSLDMAFVLTSDDCDWCPGSADLNRDGIVNLEDLAIFADQHLTAGMCSF